MRNKNNTNNHLRGFTLVELLVVIAIIAVLVAIGVGGIFKYRNSAAKVVVMGNMRNLQQTNAAWAGDHNGRYISAYTFDEYKHASLWFSNTEFLSYLTGDNEYFNTAGNYKKMPVSLLDPKVVKAKKKDWQSLESNYGYNAENMPGGSYGSANSDVGFRVSQVENPARTAAFISCTDWLAKYTGRYIWNRDNATEGKTGDGKIAYRYDDKAAVVYYDGHVGFVSKQDMIAFDKNGKSLNVFWNATTY